MKALKVFNLCFLFLIGIGCLGLVLSGVPNMLMPLATALFCAISIIFNFKSIRLIENKNDSFDNPFIDENMVEPPKVKIHLLLWIGQFILGFGLIVLSIYRFLQQPMKGTSPEAVGGVINNLLGVFVIALGVSLLIDLWSTRKLVKSKL